MARREGPGVLKFLPDGGDDVTMRDSLWRGSEVAALRAELGTLATVRNRLLQELSDLCAREAELCKAVQNGSLLAACPTFAAAERCFTMARDIEAQIRKKVETIKGKECLSPVKPVFGWQERAVQLIMLHKLLKDTEPDGDCVAGTHGATIGTAKLLQQLRTEGYSVVERRLRAFMRRCGVAGQQGKRTELRDKRRAASS